MMEESPEATAKREDMLKMYHACKESLRIIGVFLKLSTIHSMIVMLQLFSLKVMSQWQLSLHQFRHQLKMTGYQVVRKILDCHHQVQVDREKLLPFSR